MPRLMRNPLAADSEQQIFVGRTHELEEFRKSVRYLLGHETSTENSLYPHIFLPYGEGGMGKSTLLRQFINIAREEGLPETRIIVLNFEHQQIPTIDTFAQLLAKAVRQHHQGFDVRYRNAHMKREALLPRYHKLEQQWSYWESLRGYANNDLDQLVENHRQMLRKTEQQRAMFGTAHEPVYLITQSERTLEELSALLAFRNTLGYTPRSFAELVECELGQDAALFLDTRQLSQMLIDDLFDLAEAAPLLLMIDAYERAVQHDDWVRHYLLYFSSDRMLTVIAGRIFLDIKYRRTFGDMYSKYVRPYNLNVQLQSNEVHEYLRLRFNLPDGQALPAELLEKITSISRGIPVALQALGDQLLQAGNLTAYLEMDIALVDQRAIVKAVTDRFLHYALDDQTDTPTIRTQKLRDRQRIRALALLLRPDAKLICALWDVSLEEGQHTVQALNDLYSFIFADYSGYSMHSLVRDFVRAHMRENPRSNFEWQSLKVDLRRIVPLIQEQIERIEQAITNVDERYASLEWRHGILDMLNALLWLGDHEAACRLLLNRWLEARFANISFSDELLALANEFRNVTLYLAQLINILQPQHIQQEIPNYFVPWMDRHAQAVLYYHRAQMTQIETVTEESLELLHYKISLLEKGYEFDPNWRPICELMAQTYSSLGHYHLYKQKDYNSALHAYDRSLEICPEDPLVLKNRGVAKHNLHNLTGALADFELALALRPGDASAFLSRGQTKRLRGDLAGALTDFDQALISRPDDPHILFIRGRLKAESGDIAGALTDFDLVLALQPDHLRARYNRGILRRRNGDQQGAIKDFDRLLELCPDDPDVLFIRGFAKAEQRELVEALKDLDRSLELRPNHPNTLYNRGVLRNIRGDFQGAIEDFELLGLLLPSHPRPVYQAARIYAVRQQADIAIDRLASAIQLDRNYRTIARTDPQFMPLYGDPRYIALIVADEAS